MLYEVITISSSLDEAGLWRIGPTVLGLSGGFGQPRLCGPRVRFTAHDSGRGV